MSAPASPAVAAPIRVAAGTTAGAAVREAGLPSRGADDAIVVVRDADGRLRDLAWTPEADVEVTPVAANTDDGRSVIRHSTAHVLAQAVQDMFPEAKLGIGPPITDGFYYDFDAPRAFTPEDLAALEKRMRQIVKEGQLFSRRVYESKDEAREELANEPYKLELVDDKSGDPEVMEVGGDELTAYDNLNPRTREREWGDLCRGPHIPKAQLFHTSGHLDWYADGMFPPMHVDAEFDEDGTVRKPGQDYYLKPMNCPMHCLIFRARGRSYRELPLRAFEFGAVYRYEKSGVVHGLTRVRGLTMDDAHIFCTRDQMRDELTSLLRFILDLLGDYGLDDFYLELSTKDPKKFVGSEEIWEEATNTLAEVAEASGLQLVPDPGGAAFYGPKISVQARDALGRSWQMSTIQLDFNFPERFELDYTAADGSRQRPVMIHRALFGSIERFFAVLTEHYAGAFPAWLAPVQVVGIPITDEHVAYLDGVAARLRAQGIRAEVDRSDDRFGKKIRNASTQKIPFVLIAGGEDAEAGAVSFRYRDGRQDNGVPVAEAIERIVSAVRDRVQV